MQDFAGKTALITGGSRGVGYATAAELARRGANIVITARGGERLASSRARLEAAGARVAAVSGDVANWSDAQRMVGEAITRFGGLDMLVNNAGVSMRGTFRELTPDTCAQVLNINLLGSVYLARAAVEPIVKARGNIVFISSIAGLFGLPGASVYCASKGALTGLSESLRLELGPLGVHVGVVNLGYTEHDPEKRILAADGSLVLPGRPGHHSQAEAARQIVALIAKRKRRAVLTSIGKEGGAANRLAPGFVEWAIGRAQASQWEIFKRFNGEGATNGIRENS
jgi:NAD(P)-dependent dehydrogenase (short-subunit alcohol dehydrogenase family)